MAQAQLDEHTGLNSMYLVDLNEKLQVKIWKKGREGIYVTLMKKGTAQKFTLPLEAFKLLLEAQDVLLLASDFLRGLVGFLPADLVQEQ
jgi:hypothetical protein